MSTNLYQSGQYVHIWLCLLLRGAFMVTPPSTVCGAGNIALAKIYGKDTNNVMGKEYA